MHLFTLRGPTSSRWGYATPLLRATCISETKQLNLCRSDLSVHSKMKGPYHVDFDVPPHRWGSTLGRAGEGDPTRDIGEEGSKTGGEIPVNPEGVTSRERLS